MTSYGQYCPIARATEIVADRWTPLLVREMLFGVRRFSDLERGLPGISRSLLVRRLDGLARAGVLERRLDADRRPEYVLTERGRSLESVVDALGQWGAVWLLDGEPRPDELDPKLLLWFVHRRINIDVLPPGRTVVRFDFEGVRLPIWLVLERPKPSVCLFDPGFGDDVVIAGDLRRFYRIWFGHEDLAGTIRDGGLVVDGVPALVRSLPAWFQLSHFARVVAETEAARTATLALRPDPGTIARRAGDSGGAATARRV